MSKKSPPYIEPSDVEAVHRGQRLVCLTDGTILPITHMFDALGEATVYPSEAVSAVAGSDEHGWYSIDLTFFDRDPH